MATQKSEEKNVKSIFAISRRVIFGRVCAGHRSVEIHPQSPSKFTPFCLEGLVQYMSLSADPRYLMCKRHVEDFRRQKLSNLSALLVLSPVKLKFLSF